MKVINRTAEKSTKNRYNERVHARFVRVRNLFNLMPASAGTLDVVAVVVVVDDDD